MNGRPFWKPTFKQFTNQPGGCIKLRALDGRIIAVHEHAQGLELVLEARNPQANPVGQPRLVILKPTVIPLVGDTIWGGMGQVFLRSGDIDFPDRREGYRRLLQDWPTSQAGKLAD